VRVGVDGSESESESGSESENDEVKWKLEAGSKFWWCENVFQGRLKHWGRRVSQVEFTRFRN